MEFIKALLSGSVGAGLMAIIMAALQRHWKKQDDKKDRNREVLERLDSIRKQLKQLEAEMSRNEVKRIRWEILDFYRSCQSGIRHTQEEFDHIVEIHGEYDELLESLGETNGKIDLAYQYIMAVYKKCQMERDFE